MLDLEVIKGGSMTAIAAVLTAVYGAADISKSANGEDEGLACEEFSVGPTNFFPSVDQEHPVEKAVTASLRKRAGFVDASWDATVTTAPPPVCKGTPVTFAKGTVGHKLGIVSQEVIVSENGERWRYGYDVGGQLVAVNQIRE
jgi:hypothetical protein